MNTETKEKKQVRVPEYVNIPFLAKRYCVDRSTVMRWIRAGLIQATPVTISKPCPRCPNGRTKYRITRAEVKYLDSMGGPCLATHIDNRKAKAGKGAAA